jgi:regulator of sigma E protease
VSILLGILLTLAILTFVVFIHEMGHFLTARLTKMKVEEFGIGIPPMAKKLFADKK